MSALDHTLTDADDAREECECTHRTARQRVLTEVAAECDRAPSAGAERAALLRVAAAVVRRIEAIDAAGGPS